MKTILASIALSLVGHAAEDGLLHQWRLGEAKDGVIPARAGSDAKFEGGAAAEKTEGLDWLRLDGTDGRAWVTDDFRSTKFPLRAITVETWASPAKPMKWGGMAGIIQDNGNYERGWLLGYVERRFSFALASEGHPRLPYMKGTTEFQDDRWYHVAGTYDAETNATRLYVNGKLEAEQKVHSGPIFYPPKAPFELGSYKDDNEFYRGALRLHEVSVFDKALDAEAIAKRFEARKHEFPLPPQPLEFTSHPQLRWERRDALRIEWATAQAHKTSIHWKRAGGGETRLIEGGETKRVSALVEDLPQEGEFEYRIAAKGSGQRQFTTPWYKFDISFYYRLPEVPKLPSPFANDASMKKARSAATRILDESGVRQGYALLLGGAGGRLAYELARQTDLQVIVVEPDAAKARKTRLALNAAGLYGVRACVHESDLADLPYGPYFANLVVSGSLLTNGQLPGESAAELMQALRPAGGVAMLGHCAGKLSAEDLRAWFERAGVACETRSADGEVWATVKRDKLKGAGDWTHQYGSADNTTNSRDDLVRGEMGILWWGEPGPRPMPDRGGRNPAPLAANGRLFVQGDRVLFGLDAYNGTVLWTFFSPEMRRSNLPRDGSNMVATDDALYITIGGECVVLNAQTGRRHTAVLAAKDRDWGWLSAEEDQLLAASVKKGSSYKADKGEWYDSFGAGQVERVVSDGLTSHDPATGKAQWTYRGGAVMNSTLTIADDVIYFVESRNEAVLKSESSRVTPAELNAQHMVALDRITGKKLWEKAVDFSKCEHMLYLVHAEGTLVATGSDRHKTYHTYAYDVSSLSLRFGGTGEDVAELWRESHKAAKDHHGGHLQHPLVIGDTFFSDSRAFHLRTGKLIRTDLPHRRGCGNMAASNHSMFYRHHFHGMWNLETNEKTQFEGIRSGCWLGLVPAQGLMLAPESSSGCSCTHSIQTSAAWAPRKAWKTTKEK